MAKEKRKAPADVPAILNALGIDWICDQFIDGGTLTTIAANLSISRSALMRWIDADEDRSARAREARINASGVWDEKAEAEIQKAKNPFELQKARELAHHFRWRASKIDPRSYGNLSPSKGEPDGGDVPGLHDPDPDV
ncbi:terminase small subunit-like protein [Burkholderia multivorans]|uniref:terminase small subunit-like protein n=1 Tax=Burkholderia multivorans TaxID=87883 RepID=UPI00286B0A27|nr:hypothetical protein [Burkholderia multivorans]